MFKEPFSFKGRIRRTEYGLSFIIYVIALVFLQLIVAAMASGSSSSYSSSGDSGGALVVYFIFLIPLLFFLWAQGAKRCHDVGNNGWFQLIPFYVFWMLFQEGESGPNKFGNDPKSKSHANTPYTTVVNGTVTGTGGYVANTYDGGHNKSNQQENITDADFDPVNKGEYKSGDLYK